MSQRLIYQSNPSKLEPWIRPQDVRTIAGQMAASLTVAKGARLARLTANQKFTPVVKTLITAPASGATLTTGGSDGTLAAGVYGHVYTYKNANGETTVSPVATVTISSTLHITVASIALPTGVASINHYLTDAGGSDFHFHSNNDGSAFNILDEARSVIEPPATNTALLKLDGSQTAKAISAYDFVTDASGNVFYGTEVPTTGPMSDMQPTALLYEKGAFLKSQLTDITAAEITDLNATEYGGGDQAYIDIP